MDDSLMKTCRACLAKEEDEKFHSIFENEGIYASKIAGLTGLPVDFSDDKPNVICRNCMRDCHIAERFRLQLHDANTFFKVSINKEPPKKSNELANNGHKLEDYDSSIPVEVIAKSGVKSRAKPTQAHEKPAGKTQKKKARAIETLKEGVVSTSSDAVLVKAEAATEPQSKKSRTFCRKNTIRANKPKRQKRDTIQPETVALTSQAASENDSKVKSDSQAEVPTIPPEEEVNAPLETELKLTAPAAMPKSLKDYDFKLPRKSSPQLKEVPTRVGSKRTRRFTSKLIESSEPAAKRIRDLMHEAENSSDLLKNVSAHEDDPEANETSFKCHFCPHEFNQQLMRTVHMEKLHSAELDERNSKTQEDESAPHKFAEITITKVTYKKTQKALNAARA